MNISYKKFSLFYFILLLSATGFFEKLQRTFYLPLPYVGDLVSSIFPISILFFLITYSITKKLLKFDKLEVYFFLIILLILIIYFFNSSELNYENISFVCNYIWILNCFIIFKYILICDNTNKSEFFIIIFYTLSFLFIFNLTINLANEILFTYEFYNQIVKRAEVTSLTTEGYIFSFFFYYLFLNKFFEKQNILYFFILSWINFFVMYEIESRGLLLFNILSIIYVFFILKNEKKLFIKKILIFILFSMSIYELGSLRIGSLIKSSLVGLDRNFDHSYYMEFNRKIYSDVNILNKKNEEVLTILDKNKNNKTSVLCENNLKIKNCTEKEIIESLYSKEISYATSSKTRFFTITNVLKEFFKKPILGISISEIKKITVNGDKIHSNLIILIASTGFIGVIIFTVFLYYVYKQMLDKKVGLFILFFILYYSFFFDSLVPFIGLTLLLATKKENVLKND